MFHPLFAAVEAAVETAGEAGEVAAPNASSMLFIDVGVFCAFIFLVVFVGIFMSRRTKEGKESESYFLAGRGLGWCLIGFSLIAANISTEQFVGMSGQASMYLGLAIASYEWMAAVTLVFVAFYFLPQFLKTGIYTIPEFLEKRYNRLSRTIMSACMAVVLISVSFAAIVYSGAKVFSGFFKDISLGGVALNVPTLCFVIGFLAMVYVVCGGLKACAWADLLQGSALIVGGAAILYFALMALGTTEPEKLMTTAGPVSVEMAEELTKPDAPPLKQGWDRFMVLNQDKLRMNLPASDSILPFTALILGLWIPNFYYWGLNQYVVQRTLGAQSLAQGQKGAVFAAFMKLLIPFIIVFPGIMAFNLFSDQLREEAGVESRNGKRLAEFEEAKLSPPGESLAIFDFNKDFAELEPEKANEIALYNASVVGIAARTGDDLMELQSAVMAKVKEENAARSRDEWKTRFGYQPEEPGEKPYDVKKQLVGYDWDSAFPALVRNLIPPGLRGFVLAAILGAVISSLAAVLNAASTIITFDIIRTYFARKATEKTLVFTGRIIVILFGVAGCCIALVLDNPKFDGIFTYIQKFQGFLSPGILAAFLFGFFARYAPAACGPTALLGSPIIYGFLTTFTDIAFLDCMAITFGIIIGMLGFLTAFFPRKEPFVAKGETTIDLRSSRSAKLGGMIVIALTIALYIYFWQYDWLAFWGFFQDLFFRLLP